MNKNVTVKINMKGVNKKLEKIAQKKYPPTYASSEHIERDLPYSPWLREKSKGWLADR